MRVSFRLLSAVLLLATSASADDAAIKAALQRPILDANQPWQEVKDFCRSRVIPMPEPTSVAEWEKYAEHARQATLDNVVLRGEAAEWAKPPTTVEWLETIEGGPEYVIKKLRFEAVPGLWIPALLYEPKSLPDKTPVILAVNGHDANGKQAPYKQERCINVAKRGMIALNLEWLNMGQLRGDDFSHYRMNQIDLCGTSGLALFYLSMSRGIDILLQHPHADAERVSVSGLSGGGWQTIILSSLDPRVTLSNPVAGYSSFITRGEVTSDLGDSEQTPVDLALYADYAQLTAIRAPRPTLLTYNDRDNCCFAAGHALPPLLDAARPIYQLYGKLENLVAHINHVPGNHNFEQDNREAFYRMIGEHFYPDQPFNARELDVTAEIKTADELKVDIPAENAGFHTVAKRLAAELPLPSIAAIEPRRARLAEVVHARDYVVTDSKLAHTEEANGVQVNSWKLEVGDVWTVPAVEFVPSSQQGTTLIVADGGRAAATAKVGELLAAGQRGVAIDPV
ncbi:MAG: acetylxylan esterase [Planctomycetaceae bacterium]|nr:acetylxylan esterase [Planctomycetaceae bacterium]